MKIANIGFQLFCVFIVYLQKNIVEMDFSKVFKQLEGYGTEQNRNIYTRHGASGNMFGVSHANLKILKKQIGTNHDLAIKLWKSENMDARCLATMIADPHFFSKDEAKLWILDCNYYNLTDLLVNNLLFKTKFAQQLMEEYVRSQNEYEGRVGWKLLALFALKQNTLSDAYLLPYVSFIESKIHESKNRTKEAMNSALIAIGCRNSNLEKRCLQAADCIGAVQVDHGNTSCKTPDARDYILKVKNRKLKLNNSH